MAWLETGPLEERNLSDIAAIGGPPGAGISHIAVEDELKRS